MPAQRLTMRRIYELLRLHYGMGASARAMARELRVSRSTVKEYLARAPTAGLTWPLADELTDGVLEERLFAASAEHGDKDLRRSDLAGEPVDDRHRLAGIVDKHLVAGHVVLSHRRRQPVLKLAV